MDQVTEDSTIQTDSNLNIYDIPSEFYSFLLLLLKCLTDGSRESNLNLICRHVSINIEKKSKNGHKRRGKWLIFWS